MAIFKELIKWFCFATLGNKKENINLKKNTLKAKE
jgi:hypothetical protein